tara:strand:- start:229 stop:459 length:231 start_codon:yes stop_codon:yes gene_type:complete
MNDLILKGLGKRKVKAILNQFIKDQINRGLSQQTELMIDGIIYLDEYVYKMYKIDLSECDSPFDVDDLFKFIGNKI